MRIAREEIFGPVVCVIPYDTVEDAIRIANDSPFGLSGAVFTTDDRKGLEVLKEVRSGFMAINGFGSHMTAPMGGVKESGIGREHGPEGYSEFLEYKTIQVTPEFAAQLTEELTTNG
jgi:acyl-CoA reductase-like NAD-dependent aldehyde dehydrogenase